MGRRCHPQAAQGEGCPPDEILSYTKMELIQTVQELRSKLDVLRKEGKTIGLVPTMGALHAGHASLVKRAVAENDVVVVSDFVNPTQFNDADDLVKYPRTLDADCRLVEACGADFVFAPAVEEIYPEPDTRTFSYPPFDTVMEGKYRPGHFNGVCQIVSKLFLIVEPVRAYFGEKDFQQLAVVREMVRRYPFGVQVVGCPIVREADGLALSSRNTRLGEAGRRQALQISKTLSASVEYAKGHTLAETKGFVEQAVGEAEGLRLEYYEIVDGNTLQPVGGWEDSGYIVGCIAVYCGDVRLIDNIKYKEE